MPAKRDRSELRHINLRMREGLRANLEREAESLDISLNEAINRRLERTLSEERTAAEMIVTQFGKDSIYKLMLVLARAIEGVERRTGCSFETDPNTFAGCKKAIDLMLGGLAPAGTEMTEGGGLLSGGLPADLSPYSQALGAAHDVSAALLQYIADATANKAKRGN